MADDIEDDFDSHGMDAAMAFRLAGKVVEMCDRVATASKIVPGAVARYVVEIDDVRFELTAKVAERDHG